MAATAAGATRLFRLLHLLVQLPNLYARWAPIKTISLSLLVTLRQ